MHPKFTFVRVKRVKDACGDILTAVDPNSLTGAFLEDAIKTLKRGEPNAGVKWLDRSLKIKKSSSDETISVPHEVAAATELLLMKGCDPGVEPTNRIQKKLESILSMPQISYAEATRRVASKDGESTKLSVVEAPKIKAPSRPLLEEAPADHSVGVYALLKSAMALSELTNTPEEATRRAAISAALVLYDVR